MYKHTAKSKKRSASATPAISKDYVVFAPEGILRVAPTKTVPCKFIWDTNDGLLNGIVELWADPEFIEPIAFSARPTVTVELYDLKFRVRAVGFDKSRRTLSLLGSSFFGGIARALVRRSFPVARRRPAFAAPLRRWPRPVGGRA